MQKIITQMSNLQCASNQLWGKIKNADQSRIVDQIFSCAEFTLKALGAALLYWQTPALFWASFTIALAFPYEMQNMTNRISDVWEQSKGKTVALLFAGAFIALPSTIMLGSVYAGARIGSELSISTQIEKRIKKLEAIYGKIEEEKRKKLSNLLYNRDNLRKIEDHLTKHIKH